MFSADVRRSAGWAVMAADPAHLFQRLSERQGIMRSGLAARERACQSWTSCVTMSGTVLRAAAVLVGGLSRVNSGGPIRGDAGITPNSSCGLSRCLVPLSRYALADAATLPHGASQP